MRTPPVLLSFLLAGGVAACQADTSGVPADDDGDDAPAPPDAGPPAPDAAPPALRFVAVGDTGKGTEQQAAVGAAMARHCAQEGCDFAVLLGDNLYELGPTAVDDPQFQTKFEEPYADLDLPFKIVVGNHDYGGNLVFPIPGLGNEFSKVDYEIEYSQHSAKWQLPATHYTFRAGNVGFIVLDTNSILWNNNDHGDQRAWWPDALAEVAGADWVLLLGHHPYRSNGTHGNAGTYDSPEIGGVEIPNPLPLLNGGSVKSFFDDLVCGNVDLYLSGHDHARQWINMPDQLCGSEMIVNGAGAEVTSLPGTNNETYFQDATKAGFLYVVVQGNTLTGQFYDVDGNLDFERTITK